MTASEPVKANPFWLLLAAASAIVPSAIVPSAIAGTDAPSQPPAARLVRGCPPEMARVQTYCVDRWEASMVDRATGARLSPYFPPHPTLLRRAHDVWQVERSHYGDASARAMPLPELPPIQRGATFEAVAVSRPGVVPQGYLTYHVARRACARAGKRLCTEAEWVAACRGAKQTKFPYGGSYVRSRCNVHRMLHPAHVLHGNSSLGHTDPRLNLIFERGSDPLLRLTGSTPACVSQWDGAAIHDMVGNLDEWVEDETGVFVGGFYSRMTTNGCDARIGAHSPSYYDYSLGTRCCADARP